MDRDELADDRIAFMAGEVGCVVFELVYNGSKRRLSTVWSRIQDPVT